ncbi:LPS biosynthesis-modulating metalloenzyme YejM, partial [Salmonella enterica subsp. enterica serovar Infantis]
QRASLWIEWLGRYAQEDNRWFSWISFNVTNFDDSNHKIFVKRYACAASDVDGLINLVLYAIVLSGNFDITVLLFS